MIYKKCFVFCTKFVKKENMEQPDCQATKVKDPGHCNHTYLNGPINVYMFKFQEDTTNGFLDIETKC